MPVSSTELFFICVHLCSSVVSFFSHEPMRTAFAQNHRSSLDSLGKGLFHVVLTCVLIAVSGAAEDRSLENGRPVIRNFLPNEYQAHDSNMVAVQDSRGLVYFGNRDLILEYDGETWRKIPVPNAVSIHGMAIDENDRIYVGGFNELGYIENKPRAEKTFVSLTGRLPVEDRDFMDVWAIHVTPQGVYFATNQRLFRWFNNEFKVWRLPSSSRLSSHWAGDHLYVAQPGVGLMRLDGDSLTLISNNAIFFGERQVPMMVARPDGSILVCTFHHGLFLLREGQVIPFPSEANAFLMANQPVTGVLLKNGSIAIATLLGGVRVLGSDGSFQALIDESVGLQTNRVHGVLQDRLGCLWLSMSYGVSRVELFSPVSFFGSYLGLKHSLVHSVLRHDGALFAGAESGLYRLEPLHDFGSPRFTLVDGLRDSIWRLENHPSGLLAVGSNGLYWVRRGKAERIYPPAGAPDLAAMAVVLRSKLHPERVFIGGFSGLFSLRYENQRWHDEGKVEGVGEEVRSLVETERGDLWLGLDSGAALVSFTGGTALRRGSAQTRRYDASDGLPPNRGWIRVYPFKGQEFFFATSRGIYRFDPVMQKFQPDSIFGERFADGSTAVNGFAWDGQDRVYLLVSENNSNGNFLERPQVFCGIRQRDGVYAWRKLPSWINNVLGSVEELFWDTDGRVLWCGTREGLLRLDVTMLPAQEARFVTSITRVSTPGGADLDEANAHSGPQSPVLDHKHNSIHFDYAAPQLFVGDKNEYQTWLEGLGNSWSGFSSQTVRNYTNLREGQYVFRVRARDGDGRLSEADTFGFSVLPPWNRTVWAYSFYVLCFGAVVFASVQLRSRALRRHNLELQFKVNVRTAELDRKNEELAAKIDALRLSEQRAREQKEKALQSEQKAVEASHAKSVFLANMSHELRTPLNAILGFAQLMGEERNRSGSDKEHLAIIMRSGEHLLGLINDVLSISKIEAGKQTLNEQVFNLLRLLKGLEEVFAPRTQAKGLYLAFELAPELPQSVLGDEGKLRQVLINLLGNAVKFTATGGISLRASWRDGMAAFEVEDTGPGIGAAEQQAIFEPFAQSRSGVDSKQGTGLGLTISRNFVRLMGGDIRVRSAEGQGSAFSFEVGLPARAEIEERQEERRAVRLEPGQPVYRILVADDRWENRAVLAKLMAAVGFQVREAAGGKEALEIWRAWRPHVIWMDIRMPDMDGIEVTRIIRAAENDQYQGRLDDAERESGAGLPETSNSRARCIIIALTASAFEHDGVATLGAGCDDFVTKPFRTATVFEKLARHLGARFVYEAASSPREADAGTALGRLSLLPSRWIEELGQAAAIGNDQAAQRIVDQIAQEDEGLGQELRVMVKKFEFERIARCIEEALK